MKTDDNWEFQINKNMGKDLHPVYVTVSTDLLLPSVEEQKEMDEFYKKQEIYSRSISPTLELNTDEIAELRTKKLYKLLNKEKCHHGFQYQTGLNIDTIPFNPDESCRPGGLYFTDFSNILYNLNYIKGIYWIVEVSLPDSVRVYRERFRFDVSELIYTKYKADKIILSEPQIFDLTTFEFTPELIDNINNSYVLKESILRYLSFIEHMDDSDKVKTFLYLANNIDFLNIDLESIYLITIIFQSCPIQYIKRCEDFRKHYTRLLESIEFKKHYPRVLESNFDIIFNRLQTCFSVKL